MKVTGHIRRQNVRIKGRTYTTYYITLNSSLKRLDVVKKALERGYITIKIGDVAFTTNITLIGETHYIRIPKFIVNKHPEVVEGGEVEYEILEPI